MVKMSRNWKTKQRTIHDDDWDPSETVTIRSYYGDHDRQVVLSAAIEQTTDEQSGQTVTRATLDRMIAAKRTLAVIGWTLLDEDGQPLPFTTDTLLNLPPEVASFIDGEIDRDWDSIAPLAASAEEAEQIAKEDQEERSTFPGVGLPVNGRAGKASASRRHEPTRVGDSERGGTEDANAPPVERV